jgi:hypothetical protein
MRYHADWEKVDLAHDGACFPCAGQLLFERAGLAAGVHVNDENVSWLQRPRTIWFHGPSVDLGQGLVASNEHSSRMSQQKYKTEQDRIDAMTMEIKVCVSCGPDWLAYSVMVVRQKEGFCDLLGLCAQTGALTPFRNVSMLFGHSEGSCLAASSGTAPRSTCRLTC